jgi:hypothetical protein
MSRWSEPRVVPAWIFAAGLILVALGLVAQSQTGNPPQTPPPVVTPQTFAGISGGFGTADSNGSMIAVTGVDVTGGSLLYLIDTQSRHISIYSAQSGSSSMAEIKWVGARNIDLDLQVDGFNDKSEINYKELARRFADSGSAATSKQ